MTMYLDVIAKLCKEKEAIVWYVGGKYIVAKVKDVTIIDSEEYPVGEIVKTLEKME